jgi:prophage regulatory protein
MDDTGIPALSQPLARSIGLTNAAWTACPITGFCWKGDHPMTTKPDCFLRIAEVLKRTGLSRATLYRKIEDGSFPAQVRLSDRCCGWRESAVNHWCKNPMLWSADSM